jgi:ABC-2 type transport system ATP-binding protein
MIVEGGGMDMALRLRGLRKSYGGAAAVAGLDLEVRRGEIVGLIGPDGAGKTTTMRVVLGLLRSGGGEVEILGQPVKALPRHLKERLGYMPQRFSLYPDLTVEENMRFFADLYLMPAGERQKRETELLEFSRLGPFRARRAGDLSGGMKQKLALSCNLIHRPELLILDEPTTGVDPVSRREFWDSLRRFAAEGLGILVSTPYMDEAELCDRVLLMHEGRALACGRPDDLARSFPHRLVSVTAADPTAVARAIAADAPPGVDVVRFGDTLHLTVPAAQAAPLQTRLQELGLTGESIEPTIEDVFVALVGRSEQEASS